MSDATKVWAGVNTVGTAEERGPGMFVTFGRSPESLSPEWFLKDDDTLIPVNGQARAVCEELPNIGQYLGAQARARAPIRASSAETYEGVYDKAGNLLFDTCSQYELEVAALVYKELWRNPDEDERKSRTRAARIVGLPVKVAEDIYIKATRRCLRAMMAK